MRFNELNNLQVSSIKRIAEIGANNSAVALSILLDKEIEMSPPTISIKNIKDLGVGDEKEEVIAVCVRIFGQIEGSILYCVNKSVANKIAKILLPNNFDVMSEMGISMINEIGNIISSSFINVISEFVDVPIIPSVPAVANDYLEIIFVNTILETGQYDDYVLDIEVGFKGKSTESLIGRFYYIPTPGSLDFILESI